MDKLNNKLIADLLLTKAMSDNVGRIERWASLDDVVDELLMDGAIDRVFNINNGTDTIRIDCK